MLLRPESRGSIELASADPAAAPLIRPNFLSTPSDRETLRRGVRLVREILAQPDLQSHSATEIAPGADCASDAALDAFIRKSSVTVHHPAGTCKMGIDDMAVVTPELKVRGLEGLRICDSSIMPIVNSSNTNAPTIMIGEKGADLIAGRQPLPAVNFGS